MRPPWIGWLVLLALACAILLAAISSLMIVRAARVTHRAEVLVDSLSRGHWIRLDSGDAVIRRR